MQVVVVSHSVKWIPLILAVMSIAYSQYYFSQGLNTEKNHCLLTILIVMHTNACASPKTRTKTMTKTCI